MATKPKKDESNMNPETSADQAQAMLNDFKAEGAQQVNPDVYWHRFEDQSGKIVPIRGVVLARRPRPDNQKQFYYVIGLTAPTTLIDSEKEEHQAKPGDYAWVDERWCLRDLSRHLPVQVTRDGMTSIVAITEVLIVPKVKRALKGGRSVWRADVLARQIKPDSKIPLIAPETSTPPALLPPREEDEEDIPF